MPGDEGGDESAVPNVGEDGGEEVGEEEKEKGASRSWSDIISRRKAIEKQREGKRRKATRREKDPS